MGHQMKMLCYEKWARASRRWFCSIFASLSGKNYLSLPPYGALYLLPSIHPNPLIASTRGRLIGKKLAKLGGYQSLGWNFCCFLWFREVLSSWSGHWCYLWLMEVTSAVQQPLRGTDRWGKVLKIYLDENSVNILDPNVLYNICLKIECKFCALIKCYKGQGHYCILFGRHPV